MKKSIILFACIFILLNMFIVYANDNCKGPTITPYWQDESGKKVIFVDATKCNKDAVGNIKEQCKDKDCVVIAVNKAEQKQIFSVGKESQNVELSDFLKSDGSESSGAANIDTTKEELSFLIENIKGDTQLGKKIKIAGGLGEVLPSGKIEKTQKLKNIVESEVITYIESNIFSIEKDGSTVDQYVLAKDGTFYVLKVENDQKYIIEEAASVDIQSKLYGKKYEYKEKDEITFNERTYLWDPDQGVFIGYIEKDGRPVEDGSSYYCLGDCMTCKDSNGGRNCEIKDASKIKIRTVAWKDPTYYFAVILNLLTTNVDKYGAISSLLWGSADVNKFINNIDNDFWRIVLGGPRQLADELCYANVFDSRDSTVGFAKGATYYTYANAERFAFNTPEGLKYLYYIEAAVDPGTSCEERHNIVLNPGEIKLYEKDWDSKELKSPDIKIGNNMLVVESKDKYTEICIVFSKLEPLKCYGTISHSGKNQICNEIAEGEGSAQAYYTQTTAAITPATTTTNPLEYSKKPNDRGIIVLS